MNRQPVKSSNIASIGYDEENKTLEVEFHSGAIWQYEPVTQEGYRAFVNAPSIGSYFFSFIKNNKTLNATEIE